MSDGNAVLEEWNQLDREQAIAAILPCNGSSAWAERLTEQRPLPDEAALFASSDEIWCSLPQHDRQQAFDSHPRLGEAHAKAATARSLSWSAGEQSAARPDDLTRAALVEANLAYEVKFGRIFLLCATGRSVDEILSILRTRLLNDEVAELREAAEQQRLITQLRLRKWLGLPPLTCTELVAREKEPQQA